MQNVNIKKTEPEIVDSSSKNSGIDENESRDFFRVKNLEKNDLEIELNHDVFFLYRMDGELWSLKKPDYYLENESEPPNQPFYHSEPPLYTQEQQME